jgi:hypothetical protein
LQHKKLYAGWWDSSGNPHVEMNGVPLSIIPHFGDPEADLALTILADHFGETGPVSSNQKCLFYAQDFKRDIVAGLPKDQHWQIDSNTIMQRLKTEPPMP